LSRLSIIITSFCSPSLFFFDALPPTAIYTLSLHDALPIFATACFLNDVVMSEATSIDFTSQEGIERWRAASLDFALNALRSATPPRGPPRQAPRIWS